MAPLLHAFTGFLTAFASVPTSHLTADLAGGVQAAGNQLTGLIWGGTLGGIFKELAEQIRPIFASVAVLMVSVAGIRMAVAQEDDSATKAKLTITLSIAGLILAFSTQVIYDAFYAGGTVPTSGAATGAGVLSAEMIRIMGFFSDFIYPVALLGLLISVARAIMMPTEEHGGLVRKALFASMAGIALYALKEAIALAAGTSGTANLSPIADGIIKIVNVFLGAASALTVLALVIAGLWLTFGTEEYATKAKGLIIRALIGFVITLSTTQILNALVSMLGQ